MSRILVGLSDEDLANLAKLSEIQHVSRAEIIRQAVTLYLEKFKVSESGDDAFGLWKKKGKDGLQYQERLRSEW